ncbi:hypothetical protein CMO93_00530 [Candidatus Woesearchaeota archaeon]|nr:hypothetical protein [Candidatus Woesearchaeota archaeon]|tara:strand:- start:39247 stop:39996 length:750 start_codon:yes stop_codon:yes gene_type:complete
MKLPDLPNVPIDMDEETIAYLSSLEGRLDIEEGSGTIGVARVEGDYLTVLGKYTSKGFPSSKTHFYELVRNSKTGEETIAHFQEPLDEVTSSLFGLALAGATGFGLNHIYHSSSDIYGFISAPVAGVIIGAVALIPFAIGLYYGHLAPSVKNQRRKLDKHGQSVKHCTNANLADIKEQVKDIGLYQGGVTEVADAVGRPLKIAETGNPEKFVRAPDEFWLRVQIHLAGGKHAANCLPGSNAGTPVTYSD